jgi:hypothetical protein
MRHAWHNYKCKKCGSKILVSDNVIENQINAKSYVNKICVYCCRVNISGCKLYLYLHCFELLYNRKTINFLNEIDRQLVLNELYFGLNRDLLCYFGRIYQKNKLGIFVFMHEYETDNIMIIWKDREIYKNTSLYSETIDMTQNDICVSFDQNGTSTPYLLRNFINLGSIHYRRMRYGLDFNMGYFNRPIFDINPFKIQGFEEIVNRKLLHYKEKDTSRINPNAETLSKEELIKILKMYSLRCDECAIPVNLMCNHNCYYKFIISKISHEESHNFKNCRLICSSCNNQIENIIMQNFTKYIKCPNC